MPALRAHLRHVDGGHDVAAARRWHRCRLTGLLLGTVLGGAVLMACSAGGAASDGEVPAGATMPDRSGDGVPPGTDPDAVAPYIEELLAAHDRVVNRIVADPEVATDRDHPLVREYVGLFEPGAPSVELAISTWEEQARAGTSIRPFSPEHPAFVSRVDGPVEAVSADEVRFPTCDERRYGLFDADGELMEVIPFAAMPGEGTAVRIDGEWKVRRLDVFAGTNDCRGEGSPRR